MNRPRLLGTGLGITVMLTQCLFFTACSKTPSAPQTPLQKGRTIYQTTCIACHNTDPHKPGSIGPEVWGSSKELLEARILHAAYPPGYKPKRGTHLMMTLPQYKDDIDAIWTYLNQ